MTIWFCLIIPFLCVAVQIVFWRQRIVWWELTLNFVVSCVVILIAKVTIEKIETSDTEYLGGYIVEVYHEEEWDEWIHRTCSYKCGKSTCFRDCSYRQYHPDRKYVIDSNGNSWSITTEVYNSLLSKFKVKEQFVDMHRHYYHIDGDMYKFSWSGDFSTLEPTFIEHSYENRIQASHSVYNLTPPDTTQIREYVLHEYSDPKGWHQRHVYGLNNPRLQDRIARFNGYYGKAKQVKINFLFYINKPRETADLQKRMWNGGNQNELNVLLGLRNGHVIWCEVMSFTDVQELKVKIQHFAENNPDDLYAIENFVEYEVKTEWKRKPFEDFNYLTVEPTMGAMICAMIFVLIANVGVIWFNINNEFE